MTYIMCKRYPRLLKHSTLVVIGTASFPEKNTVDAISRALLKIQLKYGLHPVVLHDQVMTESEMEVDPVRAF